MGTRVFSVGTDDPCLIVVTADVVSVVSVARWINAAFVFRAASHRSRAPVELAMVCITIVTHAIITPDHLHLPLEPWSQGLFQSLDEGIYLAVEMNSTLSEAETCSNQEQRKS